jgi:glycerate kinase
MTASRRRVVMAPDSFKGTIDATAAAAALAAGWRSARPDDDIVTVPMADGGEGTLKAFAASVPGARRMPVTVRGPAGAEVAASWLLLAADAEHPATGVVELANTSGIELLRGRLRPLDADSTGFGQAIHAALEHGVGRLVLAIGGSASSDGGAGALRALGARLVDADGDPVAPGARGLESLARLDLSELRPPPRDGVVVLSDVDSPLLGSRGAARVFAPQKGASAAEVERIERALTRWGQLLGGSPDLPGAGAAGGVGYGLLAWGARIVPGAETIADLVGLPAAVRGAAFVVTGEGSFDGQSARGKAPSVVIDAARDGGVPVAVVAGRVLVHPPGVTTLSLTDLAGDPQRAMADPARWLREAGRRLSGSFDAFGDGLGEVQSREESVDTSRDA